MWYLREYSEINFDTLRGSPRLEIKIPRKRIIEHIDIIAMVNQYFNYRIMGVLCCRQALCCVTNVLDRALYAFDCCSESLVDNIGFRAIIIITEELIIIVICWSYHRIVARKFVILIQTKFHVFASNFDLYLHYNIKKFCEPILEKIKHDMYLLILKNFVNLFFYT